MSLRGVKQSLPRAKPKGSNPDQVALDRHANKLARDDSIASMRKAFGKGLVNAAKINEDVIALTADLRGSIGFSDFAKKFPDRFLDVGIAEQNLVTVASGIASMGKIPFAGAYAVFSPGRNWEQIRTTICMNNVPVKIVGGHAGVNVGPDGGTHQALEDIALMRVLPNMVVIAPADAVEAEQLAEVLMNDPRPNYVRIPRADNPVIFDESHQFEIGPAYILREGNDITLLGTGTMTPQLLQVAEMLASKIDCEVIHVPTIKPLDEKTILKSIKKTGKVVTAEEHQIAGGFGSAILEMLNEYQVKPDMLRIGINDEYGQSGSPDDILDYYGLTAEHIAKRIRRFV